MAKDRQDRDAGLEDETGTDRKFVTALARGLDILRAYRAGEHTLTNQQLAERTGLPKPTVTRLTYTLRAQGCLIYSETGGGYRLGPAVLGLGYAALAGMEMRERALPAMDALARTEGLAPAITVALAERVELKAIYVAVRRAPQTVALTLDVGARLPLGASAVGKAILAAMTPEARAATLDILAERYPQYDSRTREMAEESVEQLAARGYVCSFGDWKAEINAIAAPIRSPDGERLFAMNVGGPSFLAAPDRLEALAGERLARVARELSLEPPATPGAARG